MTTFERLNNGIRALASKAKDHAHYKLILVMVYIRTVEPVVPSAASLGLGTSGMGKRQ